MINESTKYQYNNACFESCPKRTSISSIKNDLCEDLICDKYYNYEQSECINEIGDGYFLNDTNLKTIDKCHSNCKTCNQKENNNSTNCLTCNNSNYYLYLGNCVSECPNGSFIDSKNNSICLCPNVKCKECNFESLENSLCISCNDGYYPKINEYLNNGTFINCYKNPEGFYLDKNESLYKPCYNICKTCNDYGDEKNNNCNECILNYTLKNDFTNDSNCYRNCTFNYYFDNENNYICTNNEQCPDEYNKYIEEKKRCIDECSNDNVYKYEYHNKCYSECPLRTKSNNYTCLIECLEDLPYEIVKNHKCVKNCSISDMAKKLCILSNKNIEKNDEKLEEFLSNLRKMIISGELDISNVTNGEDIIIEENGISLTITTTENQKRNKNNNMTTINLGKCEDKIKESYKISKEKVLYLLKIDVYEKGMLIPKIEYEIYYPLIGEKLVNLSLSVCSDSKIDISIPVSINETEIDKHNSSSAYYNNICYTSTSKNGTDITLTDRKTEFVENNFTLCEENCDFTGYDSNTKKALCSCKIKIKLPLIAEIKIDKKRLFDSFSDIKSIVNLNVIKCYDVLFTINGLLKNIGCYIVIPIILFSFICIILFHLKDSKEIKIQINEIVNAKKNINNNKKTNTVNNIETNQNQIGDNIQIKQNQNIKEKTEDKGKEKSKINQLIENEKDNNDKSQREDKEVEEENKIKNPPKKRRKKISEINLSGEITQKMYKKDDVSSIKFELINRNISTKNKNLNKIELRKQLEYTSILKYNGYELNNLPYEDAKLYDKRTFFQYYISLIKTKHILMFSFFYSKDYNSRIIKIYLFLFSFAMHCTVNALFFNDSTLHKIYEDGGAFNFIYQIPQIIYSSILSVVLNIILKSLALSEKAVLGIKNENKNSLDQRASEVLKCLFYKFIAFFIISFLFLLFFWYYLASFCAVYINTQLHLLKDSLISFGLSMLYPFAIYLLPCIFRIPALRNNKKNKEIMYNFSKIIQMI